VLAIVGSLLAMSSDSANGYSLNKRLLTGLIVGADTTPPTNPRSLRVTAVSATSVTLTWQKSADRGGVAGYNVYRDDQKTGTTAATTTRYAFTSLSCGRSYRFSVQAYDRAGNVSARSTILASTAACSDTLAPNAPATIAQQAVTPTSITLSWPASSDDFGVVGYEVFRDGALVASTASTQFSITALQCATMYTLGVRAFDAAGNRSPVTSVLMATSPCPDTTAPSAPVSPAQTSANQSSVALSWGASTDAVGVVGYTVYRDGAVAGSTPGTSYIVASLSCGSTYTIAVEGYDAAGNRSARSSVLARTSACPPPPAPAPAPDTTAPSAPTAVTPTSATATAISVSWTAAIDNVGVTSYGLYRDGSSAGSTSLTNATFSGLTCGRSYQLAIDAVDAAGNRSSRTTVAASTAPCPDTAAPSSPTGLTQASAAETTVNLAWTASTDNVAVAGYGVYLAGVRIATSSSPAYVLAGLNCGTSYTAGVDAYDAAGNRSAQATLVVRSRDCQVDTQAPSVPQNQTVGSPTQNSFTMAWSPSTDNVGVAGYSAFLNGTKVGTTTGTTYVYTGLACGATYTVALEAFDAAGNASNRNYASGPATTSACASTADTTAPSAPTSVTAGSATQTSITLSWSPSSDNVAVTGYGYYRNGTFVSNGTGTSYMFGGLACGTNYTLAVDAYDAAGNRSSKVSASAATTACSAPSPPPPPPPSSGVSVAAGQSWQAAYDSAPSGSTITVLAGSHGTQRISGSKQVTFLGQAGAVMRQFWNEASNLTLDNVDIDGGGQKLTILEAHGANNVYRNLEIRNNTDQQMITNAGSNALYDNVFFHDAVETSAGEAAGVHMECLWSNGPAIKVRNSTFKDCAIMDLYLTLGTWWGQQPYTDVVVEDNIFYPSERTNNSGTHFYGFLVNGALPVNGWSIKRNRFDSQVGIESPVSNSVICGNTGSAPTSWKVPC
jgi:chitodextrinase